MTMAMLRAVSVSRASSAKGTAAPVTRPGTKGKDAPVKRACGTPKPGYAACFALLRTDNVVSPSARGFADLGIQPVASDAVIEDYLWRFRPSGQYDAIKQSAKNLRAD